MIVAVGAGAIRSGKRILTSCFPVIPLRSVAIANHLVSIVANGDAPGYIFRTFFRNEVVVHAVATTDAVEDAMEGGEGGEEKEEE